MAFSYSEYVPDIRAYTAYLDPRAYREYLPKFRPEVALACVGFVMGMCITMGVTDTVSSGAFVLSFAADVTCKTANWFVEPKYTDQEDLPPGFRGEFPGVKGSTGCDKSENSTGACQLIDPSALVCSTVRVSGFDFLMGEKMIFSRRQFDEIGGRAPLVSENHELLAFWCETADTWRITLMEDEQLARGGSCQGIAASAKGVQFKDAANWTESLTGPLDFKKDDPSNAVDWIDVPDYFCEVQAGNGPDSYEEDAWIPGPAIMCR